MSSKNGRSRIMMLSALVCAACSVGHAWAGDAGSDFHNKVLSKRAAEADCYRKLAETVYGLQLNSETYVRDFVTENDEIRTNVNAWVRGVRLSEPRFFEGNLCEVDGEVTVAKLITNLTEIHAAHYKGNTIKSTDFEHIKKTVKTDVIRVTGAGAPRPQIPELPEGFEDSLASLAGIAMPRHTMPSLWKRVGPQAILLAERAAKVDAMRRLLEQIKGLRLNSNTLVRDFITEYDEISARAEGIVIGAREVRSYIHDNELIAEVTVEVPVEKVMTKIKELHAAYYKGNRVVETDIVNVHKEVKRKMIRATGMGVPPARFINKARAAGADLPSWLNDRLEAVGQGTDPEITTAQGRLKAARAAELDAKRKLAERIYGLQISSATSVRDFVTEYDEIQAQVNAVLAGAVADSANYNGGIATVRVSIPAADVWSVVHQHMLIVKRRG